jgi:hypothetical protein
MKKTVFAQCYNEAWLLPWWLKHHREIFDHGIIFDYQSTDETVDIIRELCPTWQIIPSRNTTLDGIQTDNEIMDYQYHTPGWLVALNITEFLYGNLERMHDNPEQSQYLIGVYTHIDMEGKTDEPKESDMTYDRPLHEQRYWGYDDTNSAEKKMAGGSVHRSNRLIHNFPLRYTPTGGRHYFIEQYPRGADFDDLMIYYYGMASLSEHGMARKTQIGPKIADREKGWNPSNHELSAEQHLQQLRTDHQPKAKDLTQDPKWSNILATHKKITGTNW